MFAKTRRTRASALIVAVAALALTLGACGSDSEESGGGGGGSQAPIKIGFAVAETGLYAFAGVPSVQGATLAAEQVNQQGGINGRRIELVKGDSNSDKQQAIQLLTKHGRDRDVLAVIGPTSSAVAPAVAPIAKDLQVPIIGPTVVTPLLTEGGFPWAFKMGSSPTGTAEKMCEVVEKDGHKRIAIMFTRDNAGQVGYKDTALECLPAVGAEVVTVQSGSDATDDYSAFISNIKRSNPDAIFTLLSGERSAQFEVQARQGGIPASVPFYGPNTVTGADFIEIGKDAVEGTIGVTEYFPGTPGEVNKAFVEAYEKRFKATPDNYAAQGYASMQLILKGIRDAGPDPTREAVQKGMSNTKEEPTVMGTGTLTIDAENNPNYGFVVVQVKDGELVLYEPGGGS